MLHRHVKRSNHRAFGAQPVAQRVADDLPAEQLQNDRQILPAALGQYLGDVTRPDPVLGALTVKSCPSRLGAIGSWWFKSVVSLNLRAVWRECPCAASIAPPDAAARQTLFQQCFGNASTSIGQMTVLVNFSYFVQ